MKLIKEMIRYVQLMAHTGQANERKNLDQEDRKRIKNHSMLDDLK